MPGHEHAPQPAPGRGLSTQRATAGEARNGPCPVSSRTGTHAAEQSPTAHVRRKIHSSCTHSVRTARRASHPAGVRKVHVKRAAGALRLREGPADNSARSIQKGEKCRMYLSRSV